jgi:amidase
MATFPEYERHDALGLAALVRSRQVSPAEVLEAAIERIEARNPTLNAVVHAFYDRARTRAAGRLDGPFAGVPFLVKDLGVQVQDERITNGSRFWKDQVTAKDSTLIRRYRAAGLVLAGVTSTADTACRARRRLTCMDPPSTPGTPRVAPAVPAAVRR